MSLLNEIAEYKGGKYVLKFDPHHEVKADRIKMIQKFPFWGQMILHLEAIVMEPDNPYIQTAATDGKRIFLNPVFMHCLPQDKRIFVHAHEVLHVVADTIGRRGSRDPALWNAATDYVNNGILQKNGMVLPTNEDLQKGMRALQEECGVTQDKIEAYFKEHKLPHDDVGKVFVLYSPDFDGKLAEEVYEILQKQEDEIDKKLKQQQKGQGKDQQKGSGGQGGDQGDEEGDEEEGDGSGSGEDEKEGGKSGGKSKGQPSRPGTPSQREAMRKYPVGSLDQHPVQEMSKEDQDKLRKDVRAWMNEARTNTRGDVPAGMDRMFDQVNNTKIKWHDLLTAELMDFKDADYTFETPDPCFFGQGITLPGLKYENKIRLRWITDTSGSITQEDMKKAASELYGIVRQFDAFDLKVTCFDTKMYDVVDYDDTNGADVLKHPWKGGGGTHFGEAFDWLMQEGGEEDEFDAVIFFTDGYGDGWYEHCAPKLKDKMIWLITEGWGRAPTPPWGKTIYYDRHE